MLSSQILLSFYFPHLIINWRTNLLFCFYHPAGSTDTHVECYVAKRSPNSVRRFSQGLHSDQRWRASDPRQSQHTPDYWCLHGRGKTIEVGFCQRGFINHQLLLIILIIVFLEKWVSPNFQCSVDIVMLVVSDIGIQGELSISNSTMTPMSVYSPVVGYPHLVVYHEVVQMLLGGTRVQGITLAWVESHLRSS